MDQLFIWVYLEINIHSIIELNDIFIFKDEGVEVTYDELKKLKAELSLRQATAKEQDVGHSKNKTIEEPSDTEIEVKKIRH